jgi:hypothetical protein
VEEGPPNLKVKSQSQQLAGTSPYRFRHTDDKLESRLDCIALLSYFVSGPHAPVSGTHPSPNWCLGSRICDESRYLTHISDSTHHAHALGNGETRDQHDEEHVPFSMCARPRWSGRSSTRLPALTQLTQIPPWPQDTTTHHGITTASSRIPRRGRVAVGSSCARLLPLGRRPQPAASSLLPAHSRIAWRDRRSAAAVWRQLRLCGCS